MLNFVTGQPGDGKTLYTLTTVKNYKQECDNSKDEKLHGRQVWYYGIRGVSETLGWNEIKDPYKWMECPAGSIIIIDEAQEVFAPMRQGEKRPESYNKFATHRHHGFDIYLITQNAMNVDFKVRSMCGVHWHVSRNFGRETATLYRFKEIQKPNDYHAKKAAIVSTFTYPKDNYELYKSAEVHTHKPKLPWKQLLFYGSLFLLLPVVVYFTASFLMNTDDRASDRAASQGLPTTLVANKTAPGPTPVSVVNSPQKFAAAQFKPINPDLPLSAPIYQRLAAVKSYPRISGCAKYQFGDQTECVCNDQQGARIRIKRQMCEEYIRNGIFDFTETDYERSGERRGLRAIPDKVLE